DMPAMSDQDMRSALQFQAPDLIPIPIEEAILDFQIVEEFPTSEGDMLRILLVAAQRDMVRSLLASLEGGGLSASMVDLVPFALMRALSQASRVQDPEPTAEAIACVGASFPN